MRLLIAALAALLVSGSCEAQLSSAGAAAKLPSPGPAQTLVAKILKTPAGSVPLKVPDGFRVELFAEEMTNPREMALLPSGDLLVVDAGVSGVWRVPFLPTGLGGKPQTWARYLKHPYGIEIRGRDVYVAEAEAVLRFPLNAEEGPASTESLIQPLTYAGTRLRGTGHKTRDVLFSRDGKRFFVAVGSESNIKATEPEGRAAILEYETGKAEPRLYATGLRNPVSLAWRPGSEDLWATVNERDGLGNDLVPDFVTRVRRGGFYGWPYFYLGAHEDPRHPGKRPDLASKVIVPDVLLPSHSAPIGLAFYEGRQFPARYRHGLFVGLHGSWNRDPLVGYKVVFLPFRQGKPTGEVEDFLTGFIHDANKGEVHGRPAVPFVLPDGSLLVSDDGSGRLWRISWVGSERGKSAIAK